MKYLKNIIAVTVTIIFIYSIFFTDVLGLSGHEDETFRKTLFTLLSIYVWSAFVAFVLFAKNN
jgi:hypothetical protein